MRSLHPELKGGGVERKQPVRGGGGEVTHPSSHLPVGLTRRRETGRDDRNEETTARLCSKEGSVSGMPSCTFTQKIQEMCGWDSVIIVTIRIRSSHRETKAWRRQPFCTSLSSLYYCTLKHVSLKMSHPVLVCYSFLEVGGIQNSLEPPGSKKVTAYFGQDGVTIDP